MMFSLSLLNSPPRCPSSSPSSVFHLYLSISLSLSLSISLSHSKSQCVCVCVCVRRFRYFFLVTYLKSPLFPQFSRVTSPQPLSVNLSFLCVCVEAVVLVLRMTHVSTWIFEHVLLFNFRINLERSLMGRYITRIVCPVRNVVFN